MAVKRYYQEICKKRLTFKELCCKLDTVTRGKIRITAGSLRFYIKYIDNTKAKDSFCQPAKCAASSAKPAREIYDRKDILYMMHDEIVDILLRAGIPASTKGFTYIHDALELMDRDSYYFSGKVCALYAKVAAKNGANASQVERAIRYAFDGALARNSLGASENYLDPVNTRNSNQLKLLFLRWKQEARHTASPCTYESRSACRAQIYHEILLEMNMLTSKLQQAASNSSSQNAVM